MRRFRFVLGLAIVPAITALGQVSVDLTLATMVDDNLYGTADPLSDRITESSISLGYGFDAEQSSTNIAYRGSLSYFSAVPERTFLGHTIGLRHTRTLGEEREVLFEMGGGYSGRFNRAAYTLYDFREYSVYANFKHYLAARAAVKAGYRFRSLMFSELGDFDFSEHNGFLQGILSLSATTTLIVEADLGLKVYHTSNQDALTRGQRGLRQTADPSTAGVTQLAMLVRVGQQVARGSGISVTARYQHNVYQEARYFSTGTALVSDEDVFDDHYGYEGGYASLKATQLLPADMRLRVTASYQDRFYASQLDDNSGSTRCDRRRILTVQFDKQFPSLGCSVGLSYDYIANSSNDPFYNHKNNAVAARISYGI